MKKKPQYLELKPPKKFPSIAGMASETGVIPDLYFPEEDQELQTSSVEGQEGRGQGGEVKKKEPVDLTPEGFIPIHKLTLEDLPEPIRTEQHLQCILNVSTRVVRVNNNGLSDLRPDNDQFKRAKQKSLNGSGILIDSKGGNKDIITNRHVLFDEEELKKSTFDVFYDYHVGDPDDEKKLSKRSVRKHGEFFSVKFSKDDIAVASYRVKDDMKALIDKHCLSQEEVYQIRMKLFTHLVDDQNKALVACLISHPLGEPKHVSFGEVAQYDMPSRTVYHTAPSKPGSSGGRLIVFSQMLFQQDMVHVGTKLLGGRKYKYARIVGSIRPTSFLEETDTFKLCPGEKQEMPPEEIYAKASGSVEIESLAAFLPVLGAFLLRAAETRLEGLDTSVLTPCEVLHTEEPLTSYEMTQSVKKVIEKLAQIVPNITPFPSSSFDDASTLLSLLESQGPCYCQSIVKMMERGIKLEDGTGTECFLSPYKAAANMSSDLDVTWPWLKERKSDLDKYDATEGCLLRKCLKLADGDIVIVILLLMIARANADVKHLHLQSIDSSSSRIERDCKNQRTTVHEQSKEKSCFEQNTEKRQSETQHFPSLAEENTVSSSAAEVARDWYGLTVDVLAVTSAPRSSLNLVMQLGNKDEAVTSEQEQSDDVSKLYSRCLAVSEHVRQHERQIHPDTEHSRQDSKVNRCRCGRPGIRDVWEACLRLGYFTTVLMRVDADFYFKKVSEIHDLAHEFNVNHWKKIFFNLLEFIEQCASDQSRPPGTVVMTFLDKTDSFPRGRHSFMLVLASEEALVYNVCLLARQISKYLHPYHFPFPVSVFGRPGNWPGNVTPPEVQRTAWRLIQDAIMASGFPPALLAALDKDTERREKLIDLYVDMKQLKWQGRIKPHLFRWYLSESARVMLDHVQINAPLNDTTHYYVWYAAFLVCPRILTSRCSISH